MSIVTIMTTVRLTDVIAQKVALIVHLSVMTIMLVPMIVVIQHLAVFSLQKLVLMEILALTILVVLFRDVYTLKKFVMTTIFVPPILAMRKLVFVIMFQQTAMMEINVPLKNVVHKPVYVFITLLTVMIKTHVLPILALLIMDVVTLQLAAHLPLV